MRVKNCYSPSEWPLGCLAILWLFSLARAIPVCPRDTEFGEDNVMASLGLGFNAAKPSAATARVVKLTTSSAVFRLPNGKTAPVPCEASKDWWTLTQESDLDVILTDLDSFSKRIARPLATLSLRQPDLTSDMDRLRQDLATPYTVGAVIYRDKRLAVVRLPMKSDFQISESRSWWSDEFSSSINSLNKKTVDSTYRLFISAYGTHLVTDIYIGGYVVLSGSVDYCQYSTAGGSAAEQEKAIQALSAAVNVQYGVSAAGDSNYLIRDASVAAGGGDFKTFKRTANAQNYLLSIASGPTSPPPAVLANTINFVPLWKLLPSSDPRRKLLRNATEDYISTFGVTPLKNSRPICTSPSSQCKSKDGEVAGLAVLVSILAAIILGVVIYQWRNRLRAKRRQQDKGQVEQGKGYETFVDKDTMTCDECNSPLKCLSCKNLIRTFCYNSSCRRFISEKARRNLTGSASAS